MRSTSNTSTVLQLDRMGAGYGEEREIVCVGDGRW